MGKRENAIRSAGPPSGVSGFEDIEGIRLEAPGGTGEGFGEGGGEAYALAAPEAEEGHGDVAVNGLPFALIAVKSVLRVRVGPVLSLGGHFPGAPRRIVGLRVPALRIRPADIEIVHDQAAHIVGHQEGPHGAGLRIIVRHLVAPTRRNR